MGANFESGLLAMLLVLGLFALVGWICRPRPRVRDPRIADVERHFVEFTDTGTAAEAARLAASLRAKGVVALANAEEVAREPTGPRRNERAYRCFVVVLAADLDRANQLLGRGPRLEGTASTEQIPEDLQDEEESDEQDDADEPPRAPSLLERRFDGIWTVLRWGIVIALVAAVVGTLWQICAG